MSPRLSRLLRSAAVLRAIAAGYPDGKSGLAAKLGRDLSNLNRTLKGLIAEGWVTPSEHPVLTRTGAAALAGLDRLEGDTALFAQMLAALQAVAAIRPTNWDDDEDPVQAAAWRDVDAAIAKATRS